MVLSPLRQEISYGRPPGSSAAQGVGNPKACGIERAPRNIQHDRPYLHNGEEEALPPVQEAQKGQVQEEVARWQRLSWRDVPRREVHRDRPRD
jgi:hypothetical protein